MKFNSLLSFRTARIDEVDTKQGKVIMTLGVREKRIEFALNGLNYGYGYTYAAIGMFEDRKQPPMEIDFRSIEENNCEWDILKEKQKK